MLYLTKFPLYFFGNTDPNDPARNKRYWKLVMSRIINSIWLFKINYLESILSKWQFLKRIISVCSSTFLDYTLTKSVKTLYNVNQ